jgi:hypothetical protein
MASNNNQLGKFRFWEYYNKLTTLQPKKYIEFYCWDIELNLKEFLKPIKKK